MQNPNAATPGPAIDPVCIPSGPWPRAAALALAAMGAAVFPLHYPSDGACSCGSGDCTLPGKHPATFEGHWHGHLDATTDADEIRSWWNRDPLTNYGVRVGPGWWVLDIDGEAGQATLDRLTEQHGPLPRTARVGTGNGDHYWFAGDPPCKNRAGIAGPGSGFDARCHGRGYVVGPGSLHRSGRRYRVTEAAPMIEAPGWLLEAISPPRPPAPPPLPTGWNPTPRVGRLDGLVAWAVRRIASAPEKTRNDTVNLVCYTLGGKLAAHRGTIDEVAPALERAAELAEQDPRRVRVQLAAGEAAPIADNGVRMRPRVPRPWEVTHG